MLRVLQFTKRRDLHCLAASGRRHPKLPHQVRPAGDSRLSCSAREIATPASPSWKARGSPFRRLVLG
ncbi:uncharacterized protein MAM_02805 [Metarhizium album ARSEF 1941]|uniref:Uncharacterized protein n=1 Tax=Metarhizium album (strain ARSEF 1941) TaxID=1081103 RepID=A0A0B2X096_METAS|nr:uncharacterized protein MAM_02805 [Metarhizium album ARSEF 1941]KHN99107.1 hypothetical protein MAM_02805 [Metarhizium album ARSEF 1941]